MDEKTQEIEKENQNLKAPQSDAPQSEIDKSRAKIKLLQMEKESMKSAYNFC